MAPSPLTPVTEESLPNFAEIKIKREEINNKKAPEDRGCLFHYETPEPKGAFFDDSFFKDSLVNYEEAVKAVLNRSNTASCQPGTTNMSNYRNLRGKTARNDTQASGLTELDDKYQLVLDVHNYAPSEVSVKAVGDAELLVEGEHCNRQRTQDGATVTQNFCRRFCLPGPVRLDGVTSAMSSDGVLKVTAPKLEPSAKTNNFDSNDNSFIKDGHTQSSVFNETKGRYDTDFDNFFRDADLKSTMTKNLDFGNNLNKTLSTENEGRIPSATSDIIEEGDHFKITLDTRGYNPQDISVKAVGDRELQVEGRHTESSETGAQTSQSFSRHFCLPGLVKMDKVSSSLATDGLLTIRAPKAAVEQIIPTNKGLQQQQWVQENTVQSSKISDQSAQRFPLLGNATGHRRSSLEDFFSKDFDDGYGMNDFGNHDFFMEKAHNDYKDSLKNIMNRTWVVEPVIPSYRPVARPLVENTSAQTSSDIIESPENYKMKLDVSKYRPQDISVKAVGDRELIVEGKSEQRKSTGEGPALTHSFCRRFCLPGVFNNDAVTSSLSPDGVLTVTAPKMKSALL